MPPPRTDRDRVRRSRLTGGGRVHHGLTEAESAAADWLEEAEYSQTVRPFVCHQTCEHDVLKTNEAILMPIGTTGPRRRGMKRSTLGVMGSKVKVTRPKIDLEAWLRHHPSFSTSLDQDGLVSQPI